VAILALLSRSVRPVALAWLAGAGATGLLGTLRAVPAAEAEAYLALLTGGALVLGYAWRRVAAPAGGRGAAGPGPGAGASGAGPGGGAGGAGAVVAIVAGLVVLLPWLWLGALGGWLETLLAATAAAAVGWLAGGLLSGLLGGVPGGVLRGVPGRDRAGGTGRTLIAGLTGGVTLLLVAAGAGASGAQLPLLLVLPPLGLVAAALPRPAPRWAVPALVGTAAFGPLAFVDPQEVTLLLTGRDVPFWTAVAAGGSLLLPLLMGGALPAWGAAARRRSARAGAGRDAAAEGPAAPGRAVARRPAAIRRGVAVAAVAAALLAAGGVHLGAGQPGFHGEKLFVILAAQADLSLDPVLAAGTGQAGRDARAAEVYRRLVDHATASQADLRAELDRLGLAYTPYYLVNAVEVT